MKHNFYGNKLSSFLSHVLSFKGLKMCPHSLVEPVLKSPSSLFSRVPISPEEKITVFPSVCQNHDPNLLHKHMYMETGRGGPVNHSEKLQTLTSSLVTSGEAAMNMYTQMCLRGYVLHRCTSQMSAIALFLGPLDSMIFPLDSSHRISSCLQRMQPLRSSTSIIDCDEDLLGGMGEGMLEISIYIQKFGLLSIAGRSYVSI